jgi:hypothetical protein
LGNEEVIVGVGLEGGVCGKTEVGGVTDEYHCLNAVRKSTDQKHFDQVRKQARRTGGLEDEYVPVSCQRARSTDTTMASRVPRNMPAGTVEVGKESILLSDDVLSDAQAPSAMNPLSPCSVGLIRVGRADSNSNFALGKVLTFLVFV